MKGNLISRNIKMDASLCCVNGGRMMCTQRQITSVQSWGGIRFCMRFAVLRMLNIKIIFTWAVMPCSVVYMYHAAVIRIGE
jgi:hypothetical protein